MEGTARGKAVIWRITAMIVRVDGIVIGTVVHGERPRKAADCEAESRRASKEVDDPRHAL